MGKKIGIALATIVICAAFGFLFYACITTAVQNHALDKTLVKIKFSDLEEKVNNKESFILVVTQESCSHCAQYKPILKEVLLEYNLTAYEIDSSKLSKEDNNKMKDIANVQSTPQTLFFVDGQEHSTTSRIVGAVKKSNIISRLKAMGYIENEKNTEENDN